MGMRKRSVPSILVQRTRVLCGGVLGVITRHRTLPDLLWREVIWRFLQPGGGRDKAAHAPRVHGGWRRESHGNPRTAIRVWCLTSQIETYVPAARLPVCLAARACVRAFVRPRADIETPLSVMFQPLLSQGSLVDGEKCLFRKPKSRSFRI